MEEKALTHLSELMIRNQRTLHARFHEKDPNNTGSACLTNHFAVKQLC